MRNLLNHFLDNLVRDGAISAHERACSSVSDAYGSSGVVMSPSSIGEKHGLSPETVIESCEYAFEEPRTIGQHRLTWLPEYQALHVVRVH